MGAATITKDVTVFGDKDISTGEIVMSSSYATGGDTLANSAFGLHKLKRVILSAMVGGYLFEYDMTNGKMKAFYADYDGVADGALIEVAAAVDLSAIGNLPFLAIG